jgi:15-cis-phytoene synthase
VTPAEAQAMEVVRTGDRDRYLSVLYAPEDKRPALFALYGFNAEIASIRDRIREPLPGEIRLQWWRDAITNDDAQGHPLAEELVAAIRKYDLPRKAFDDYLEARIFDLYDDPMPGRAELEGYCGETASALIQLASFVLDREAAAGVADAAGHAGCAQAITGLIRLLPLHRARGQCFVPKDVLTAAGTTPETFVAGGDPPAARRAVTAMIALAGEHLAKFEALAASLPQALRPAFLPLALTKAYLGKATSPRFDVLVQSTEIWTLTRHWLLFSRATRGWR